MKTERLLGEVLLLSRRKHSAEELADIFEVSVRTIYRDINSLCLAKVPVVALPGPGGGYELMEGFKIDPTVFSVGELSLLFLGARALSSTEFRKRMGSALIKLESILPSEYREEIEEVKKRVLFDITPWFRGKEELDPIYDAIFEKKKMRFLYPSRSKLIEEEREVLPAGLVNKAGVWYLVAYCQMRKGFRTFRVDRMKEMEVLDETFILPSGFDVAKYWKEAVEGFEKERDKLCVKIKIDRKMAKIVRMYIADGERIERCEDGGLIMHLDTDDIYYATHFVLSLGGSAEVLEPSALREMVMKEAESILARYKN